MEKVQLPREQARAIVEVVRDARDSTDVATKGDIALLETKLEAKIELVDQRSHAHFKQLYWMLIPNRIKNVHNIALKFSGDFHGETSKRDRAH